MESSHCQRSKKVPEELGGKTASIAGGLSGAASIMGSWQICHSVCLGLISVLGLIGISLTGMPLAFLTGIALPLWILAVLMLGLMFYLYFKHGCVSKNLLFVNMGLIFAGTPFHSLEPLQDLFWIFGGTITVLGLFLYIREKVLIRKVRRHNA